MNKKTPKKPSKKPPNSIYLFTSQFCLSLFFKDPSFVSLIRCLIREKALLTSSLQSSPFKGTHDLIPRIPPAQEFSLQHTQNKPLQGNALSTSPWPGTGFANVLLSGWDGTRMEIPIFLPASSLPCWLELPLGRCPAQSQPWHRDAVVEQGWFSLPAPFVCRGFVGCSEPWQGGAALGRAPQSHPLPKGGTNPSLMDGK